METLPVKFVYFFSGFPLSTTTDFHSASFYRNKIRLGATLHRQLGASEQKLSGNKFAFPPSRPSLLH